MPDGTVALGCKLCQAVAQRVASGDFAEHAARLLRPSTIASGTSRSRLRAHQLAKHQTSFTHRFAVRQSGALLRSRAPAHDDFRKVIRAAKDGIRRGVDGVGVAKKLRRIIWCVAEAIRQQHRVALRRATSIAIHQDKRAAMLLVRFTAADAAMTQVSGILGLVQSHGGHLDIIRSTEDVVRSFCTAGHGRPPSSSSAGVAAGLAVDEELMAYVKAHVHLFNSDAEGAELRAGQMSRFSVRGLAAPLFPHLKCVCWDGAHASRRVMRRPWDADAYLRDVIDRFVLSTKSPVSLIHNSPEFRIWLANSKKLLQDRVGDRVVNFSLARHRFDSTVKPVSRAVLNVYALVRTCEQVVRLRKAASGKAAGRGRKGGDPAGVARKFLDWVTTERIVVLAMLADAGQEAIGLVRALDHEDAPVEDVPWLVRGLLQRITMLFVDGEVVRSGHTQWVLRLLERPLLLVVGGQPKTLGSATGVPADIVAKALAHMS